MYALAQELRNHSRIARLRLRQGLAHCFRVLPFIPFLHRRHVLPFQIQPLLGTLVKFVCTERHIDMFALDRKLPIESFATLSQDFRNGTENTSLGCVRTPKQVLNLNQRMITDAGVHLQLLLQPTEGTSRLNIFARTTRVDVERGGGVVCVPKSATSASCVRLLLGQRLCF